MHLLIIRSLTDLNVLARSARMYERLNYVLNFIERILFNEEKVLVEHCSPGNILLALHSFRDFFIALDCGTQEKVTEEERHANGKQVEEEHHKEENLVDY